MPVVPIVAPPSAVIQPMLDALRIQNGGQSIGFTSRVVPFAGTENDAHVIAFPRFGHVWEVFVWAVKVNVVIVITVEERADIE